jgi:hypothetical protein
MVEVDATHIFSRKYHRDRMLVSESVWVFVQFYTLKKVMFANSA